MAFFINAKDFIEESLPNTINASKSKDVLKNISRPQRRCFDCERDSKVMSLVFFYQSGQ